VAIITREFRFFLREKAVFRWEKAAFPTDKPVCPGQKNAFFGWCYSFRRHHCCFLEWVVKGKLLLLIALPLIFVSVLGEKLKLIDQHSSSLAMLAMIFCRVGGVLCFIIGVLRIRREKKQADQI
jgi:hypothetical protein